MGQDMIANSRLDGWVVRASTAMDDDPELSTLLLGWSGDLGPEPTALFADLADRAYRQWQEESKVRLADALDKLYQELKGP
jgi:hypothetical protein